MFPPDQPINEESGKKVAAWAAGGTRKDPTTEKTTEAIPDSEVEALINSMDVKTMKELQETFGVAWKRATAAKDDNAKRRFKSVYDDMKTALEAGAI